ncbi:MAG: hypothetical protein IJM59_05530 [Proteobacteria bacterium]|nr:hypothetical protein [Pseudomonadota bacterium]
MKLNRFIILIPGCIFFSTLWSCSGEQDADLEFWCIYSGGKFIVTQQVCQCGDTPCVQGVVCLEGGKTCASNESPKEQPSP